MTGPNSGNERDFLGDGLAPPAAHQAQTANCAAQKQKARRKWYRSDIHAGQGKICTALLVVAKQRGKDKA